MKFYMKNCFFFAMKDKTCRQICGMFVMIKSKNYLGYVFFADEKFELWIILRHDLNTEKPELSLIFECVFC